MKNFDYTSLEMQFSDFYFGPKCSHMARRNAFSSQEIARIENTFILHAQYRLGVREQKVILYLIAQIDPTKDAFEERIIPVKELESMLKNDGRKWGGIYREMEGFCENIIGKRITFNTDVLIDGRPFKGRINWFQSVVPMYGEGGEVCIRFLFASDLKPFLLQLKEYAQINRLEVARMRSTYSIRLFQIFKSLREKHRKHRAVVEVSYEVDELKKLLLIEEQYTRFNNLRQRVLEVACTEINQQTSLLVSMEFIRNSSKEVSHVRFSIRDNDTRRASADEQLAMDFANTKRPATIPNSPETAKIIPQKLAQPAPSTARQPIQLSFPPFEFESFKDTWPDTFHEIEARVVEHFEAFKERINNREMLIQNTLKSQCEKYYKTYMTQEIAD